MPKMLIGRRRMITDILKINRTFLEEKPKPNVTQYDELRHCVTCDERSKRNNNQEVCS